MRGVLGLAHGGLSDAAVVGWRVAVDDGGRRGRWWSKRARGDWPMAGWAAGGQHPGGQGRAAHCPGRPQTKEAGRVGRGVGDRIDVAWRTSWRARGRPFSVDTEEKTRSSRGDGSTACVGRGSDASRQPLASHRHAHAHAHAEADTDASSSRRTPQPRTAAQGRARLPAQALGCLVCPLLVHTIIMASTAPSSVLSHAPD